MSLHATPFPHQRPLRKGEATAARILDAAEALFAERGFEGTALRDVAGHAGLRTPSLYNHFESKEALYASVLERGFGPVLALLEEVVTSSAVRRPDSGEIVGRVMELLAARPALPRLILHETLAGGSRLSPMLRAWIGPAFARAADLVDATPSARTWESEYVPLLVLALYHAVVGYFTIAPLYRDLAEVDLLADAMLARQTQLLRQMVDALLPPAEPDSTARS